MASTNEAVAELLGLTGGDMFRVRSYEKAAKAVGGYPDDLGTLPESALTKVPGVGKSVATKIAEYRRTGTIRAVDDLRATVPPGALVLAKVPGVGPKRALQIADERGHTDLTDGIVSLAGMIAAAEARGYEYCAVTGHAPSLVMQRMTDEKMLAQRAELRALANTTSMAPRFPDRGFHKILLERNGIEWPGIGESSLLSSRRKLGDLGALPDSGLTKISGVGVYNVR
jgi:DNA polymerase/3'-5' exonuclease PolX